MTDAEKIQFLRCITHAPLIECRDALLIKFKGDEIASYYYLMNGKNPYYYTIYSKELHSLVSIVENEDIAKDVCGKESKLYYIKRRIQEKEIKGILDNYKIAIDFGEKNRALVEASQKEANENFKKELQKILDGVEENDR